MKIGTLLLSSLFTTVVAAQTSVTVTTGPGNGTQTFYSLMNGEQGSAPLADWDLGFEIAGFTSSILVNTAKGLTAFETPAAVADWGSVDTPDEANWTPIYNAETDWSEGALTNGNDLDQPDGFNVGGGTYSIITHTIVGTKIYVVKFLDQSYKKLRINSLLSGTYSFTYADLDGSNEQTATLTKSNFTGKNFGYFSFASGTTSDPEPPTASWDLLFTKYTGFIPTPYGLTGVLLNKNVWALQVDGVDPALADWNSAPFDTAMNIIGSDWKVYDQANGVYTYVADRTYFVEDLAGNVWKLIFTGYGGGATGDITFSQELVSATTVDETTGRSDAMVIFPNPVANGTAQVILGSSTPSIVLSMMDLSGKLVLQRQLTGASDMTVRSVDVSALSPGIYVVRAQGVGLNTTTRLVVE